MCDAERRTDIDGRRPVGSAVAGVDNLCVTVTIGVTEINRVRAVKIGARFANVVLTDAN